VYGEKKHILNWANYINQGKTKISCTGMQNEPKEPMKEGLLSLVLLESPLTFVAIVKRGRFF
jgi:hypothetical protein